jgi:hypothetical protein
MDDQEYNVWSRVVSRVIVHDDRMVYNNNRYDVAIYHVTVHKYDHGDKLRIMTSYDVTVQNVDNSELIELRNVSSVTTALDAMEYLIDQKVI